MVISPFEPMSLLEVDNLQGGRKVVMVSLDGQHYWDRLDDPQWIPVPISNDVKPDKQMTIEQFFAQKTPLLLMIAIKRDLIRRNIQVPDNLYLIRLIIFCAKRLRGDEQQLDGALLDAALEEADAQSQRDALAQAYLKALDDAGKALRWQ